MRCSEQAVGRVWPLIVLHLVLLAAKPLMAQDPSRIKLDVIRDFTPIGSTDFFDARTIPVDGSEGTNSRIHARPDSR